MQDCSLYEDYQSGIIAVESDPVRTEMSKRMGADVVLDFTKEDVIDAIKHLTRGRGVDVAIEALGNQGETSARGHPDFLAEQEHLEIGLGNKMFLHLLTSDGLGQLALMYD